MNWEPYRRVVPFWLRAVLWWLYSWLALAVDLFVLLPFLLVCDVLNALKDAMTSNPAIAWSCHRNRMDHLRRVRMKRHGSSGDERNG